jgi:hypothetical protein
VTEIKETIKYTPYRGVLEPVTEVRKAEINLYPNHIEIINSYDYQVYMPSEDSCGYTKNATLIPKPHVIIELTETWHERDTAKTPHPVVRIMYLDIEEFIHVQTQKEAYDIYTKLKLWLLNE